MFCLKRTYIIVAFLLCSTLSSFSKSDSVIVHEIGIGSPYLPFSFYDNTYNLYLYNWTLSYKINFGKNVIRTGYTLNLNTRYYPNFKTSTINIGYERRLLTKPFNIIVGADIVNYHLIYQQSVNESYSSKNLGIGPVLGTSLDIGNNFMFQTEFSIFAGYWRNSQTENDVMTEGFHGLGLTSHRWMYLGISYKFR